MKLHITMSEKNVVKLDDVVIIFSGDSGDGMQLTGTLFSDASAYLGNGISTFPDYPSEIRAPQGTVSGVSGFQVRFSNKKVTTPGDYCDVLVAMNPAALKVNAHWLKSSATVIVDGEYFNEKEFQRAGFKTNDPIKELGLEGHTVLTPNMTQMTFDALAELEMDKKAMDKSKNMFALGVCFYLYSRELKHTEEYMDSRFGKRAPKVAQANKLALRAGYNYGANTHAFANTYEVAAIKDMPKGIYRSISGNQATAWGLLAASEKSGRPLFCGSYPITPATVILEELAKRKDLGVKTVQAEDEIAGICTSIGASWAGSLAVTTTSGPGLSLKSEAMGLAVMTELPLVVVNVQRGGPSTGLPTKTEQSDLYQALWGRNGECPMIVIAASTPTDCFDYAFYAAKYALEHMTPVLLLTDGFIANGSQPWLIPSMKDYPTITPPIAKPRKDDDDPFLPYKRDTERLARSWAIPGTAGLQNRIGGLEKHFTTGAISHDPENHQKMVNIRAEKVARVADYIPEQEVVGAKEGDLLVVGWGGTKGYLLNAVEELQQEGKKVSLCHFNYINPMPKNVGEIFSKYKKIIVCELNMGQFVNYLKMNFHEYDFLQYNKVQGAPFMVEELKEKFNAILEEK